MMNSSIVFFLRLLQILFFFFLLVKEMVLSATKLPRHWLVKGGRWERWAVHTPARFFTPALI